MSWNEMYSSKSSSLSGKHSVTHSPFSESHRVIPFSQSSEEFDDDELLLDAGGKESVDAEDCDEHWLDDESSELDDQDDHSLEEESLEYDELLHSDDEDHEELSEEYDDHSLDEDHGQLHEEEDQESLEDDDSLLQYDEYEALDDESHDDSEENSLDQLLQYELSELEDHGEESENEELSDDQLLLAMETGEDVKPAARTIAPIDAPRRNCFMERGKRCVAAS